MADFEPASPILGTDGFPRSGWTPPDARPRHAPGGEAAGRGTGPVPPAPPPEPRPAPAPAPAPVPRAPVVRDLSGKAATGIHDLLWPKEVDGVEIRQVVMKRMSTGEVVAFIDRVREGGEGASDRFPLFYRPDGALLTDGEWSALDPDDTDALGERAERFLPARFRAAAESDVSSPPAPATTGSSSGGSPASA